MMNLDGTSASTLIELNWELLEEMDKFIDKLPTELPKEDIMTNLFLYPYTDMREILPLI